MLNQTKTIGGPVAFKLSKAEKEELDRHINEIKAERAKIEDAVAVLNDEIASLIDNFNGVHVEAYNQKLDAIVVFLDNISSTFRADFDDKSEAWQEGERGCAANEFVSKWEDIEIETIEPVQVDEVDFEGATWADDELEELPSELE